MAHQDRKTWPRIENYNGGSYGGPKSNGISIFWKRRAPKWNGSSMFCMTFNLKVCTTDKSGTTFFIDCNSATKQNPHAEFKVVNALGGENNDFMYSYVELIPDVKVSVSASLNDVFNAPLSMSNLYFNTQVTVEGTPYLATQNYTWYNDSTYKDVECGTFYTIGPQPPTVDAYPLKPPKIVLPSLSMSLLQKIVPPVVVAPIIQPKVEIVYTLESLHQHISKDALMALLPAVHLRNHHEFKARAEAWLDDSIDANITARLERLLTPDSDMSLDYEEQLKTLFEELGRMRIVNNDNTQ